MNKIVVITGATSGIGFELKKRFEKNNEIVINISKNCKRDTINFPCDISNIEELKNVFSQIKDRYHTIDILINCAGYGIVGATHLIDETQAKQIFDVNFFGTLNSCKYAIPLMQENSKIVNISSACAIFPMPYRSLYCASKSAVSMISECLQMELKSLKINVCHICPGDIKTNFSKNRVKILTTNDNYENKVKSVVQQIDKQESKRMDINYACNKIYKIINKNKYKPIYIIGKKYKLLYLLNKIFPRKWINKTIEKKFGGD